MEKHKVTWKTPSQILPVRYCDGCHTEFPIAELRVCDGCGRVYCRNCQIEHEKENQLQEKRNTENVKIKKQDMEKNSLRPLAIIVVLALIGFIVVLSYGFFTDTSPQQTTNPNYPLTTLPTDTYPHINYQTNPSDTIVLKNHQFLFEDMPLNINIRLNENLYGVASSPESKESDIKSQISDDEWTIEYYQAFAEEPVESEMINQIISEFNNIQNGLALSSDEYVELVTAYVQSIPYYTTTKNDPQYPIETLYQYWGDCDDKSILLVSILSRAGYDVALLDLPDENHMTAAIKVAPQYSYLNSGYAMIETTGYYMVSEVPEETIGTNLLVIPIGIGTKIYTAADEVSYILEKWEFIDSQIEDADAGRIYLSDDEYNNAVDHYNLLAGLEGSPNREAIYQKMLAYS